MELPNTRPVVDEVFIGQVSHRYTGTDDVYVWEVLYQGEELPVRRCVLNGSSYVTVHELLLCYRHQPEKRELILKGVEEVAAAFVPLSQR